MRRRQMESMGSKFADSLDQGSRDAADGPISNMSAQGVTGNQMPKDDGNSRAHTVKGAKADPMVKWFGSTEVKAKADGALPRT